MRLNIDTNTMRVVNSRAELKLGDKIPLLINFTQNRDPILIDENAEIHFVAKKTGDYNGNPLVLTDSFSAVGPNTGAKAIVLKEPKSVASVTLDNTGSDYTSVPTVTLEGGGGSGAIVEAEIENSGIRSIEVVEAGNYYGNIPKVTITNAPTDTTGKGAAASVFLSDGEVAGIILDSSGFDYTLTPTVSVIGGTGSGATATAILETGKVTGLTLVNPGSGYDASDTVVTISGSDGSGAEATAEVVDGKVTGIHLSNQGSGYITIPTVTITGSGLGATATASIKPIYIKSVNISNGGTGYYSAPAVRITGGGGSGATAIANIWNGIVSSVDILDNGEGYTGSPTIELVGGTGSGATAHAVMSPQSLKGIQVTDFGSGYGLPPTIEFIGVVAPFSVLPSALPVMANDGTLESVNLTQRAWFTDVPTVSAYGGGLVGAVCSPIMEAKKINHLKVLTSGSGYINNVGIQITGGGGSGATAKFNIRKEAIQRETPKLSVYVNDSSGSYTTADVTYKIYVRSGINSDYYPVGTYNNYKGANKVSIWGVLSDKEDTDIKVDPPITGGPAATCAYYWTYTPYESVDYFYDSVEITNQGSGYTSAPTITITGPYAHSVGYANGVQFEPLNLIPQIVGGKIVGMNLSNRKSRLVSGIRVYVQDLDGNKVEVPLEIDSTGGIVKKDYSIASEYLNGESASFTYTLDGYEGSGATFQVGYAPRAILGVEVVNPGSGWGGSKVNVAVIGGGGSGASGHAVVNTNGKIYSIVLSNAGTGYTTTPTISVFGGNPTTPAKAVAIMKPTELSEIVIDNPGKGYTLPEVIINGVGSGAKGEAVVKNGKIVDVRITSTGTGYYTPPTITVPIPTDSFNATAKATAVLSTPKKTGDPVSISTIQIDHGGSGYSVPPQVLISGGDGNGATAIAKVSEDGSIIGVEVTSGGDNYRTGNLPSVSFIRAAYTPATIEPVMDGGFVDRIEVTNTGSGYAVTPQLVFSGGGGSGASGFVTVDGEFVNKVVLTSTGSGYLSAPSLSVTSPSNPGFPAIATLTYQSPRISGFTLTNGGSGYNVEIPEVVITGGGGLGATASVELDGYKIYKVNVTNPGTGYNTIPTIDFISKSGGGAIVAPSLFPKKISKLNLISGGSGYTEDPTVKIEGGGGLGATATATLDSSNFGVTTIEITDSGKGYVIAPKVTIDQSPEYAVSRIRLANATAKALMGDGGEISALEIQNPGYGYSEVPDLRIEYPPYGYQGSLDLTSTALSASLSGGNTVNLDGEVIIVYPNGTQRTTGSFAFKVVRDYYKGTETAPL